MSTDRTIRCTGKKPSRGEVKKLLHDFFNGAHDGIKWDRDRFFVRLPGKARDALAGVDATVGMRESCREGAGAVLPSERWIEVWVNPVDGSFDVITRMADDYTCALADGITAIIARYWGCAIEV